MNWNKCVFRVVLFILCNNQSNCLSLLEKSEKPLSPVVLVPGNGGSQIEAKLDKRVAVDDNCNKKSRDWFTIWLTHEMLFPIMDCWLDNFSLIYDNKTRTTRNAPGVEIRVPGWGDTKSVEWLESSILHFVPYFNSISNSLVANGYVRNVSIRAAPYDFRKAPNENRQWFSDLKTLVEETYEANNKTPVTFIAHSMGSPMTLLFLQEQDKTWKSKYVSRIISLAGAFNGGFKFVKSFVTGDNFGIPLVRTKIMRKIVRTFPSRAWLIPTSVSWKPDDVVVQTQSRNYTISDLEDFFNDMDDPDLWEMRKDTLKYTDFTGAPGVEFHCLYGSDVPTVNKLVYSSNDLNSDPKLMYGHGDGTVHARSLELCTHWIGMEEQLGKNVSTLRLPGAQHIKILHDNRVLKYILEVLAG